MRRYWEFLKFCVCGGEDTDGFGQSLFEDVRFLVRFRRCRSRLTVWDQPSSDEAALIDAHPIMSRFGDDTIAIAQVDGARWLVREHDFYGWPDPARYVFFASDGDRITVAAGFNQWPKAWSAALPAKTQVGDPIAS